MASKPEAFPLMVALRGTQGLKLSYAQPELPQVEFFANLKVDSRFLVFSPFGRYLVYHTPLGVQLADIEKKEVLDLGPTTVLVRDAAFSPQESYLILWDAPSKKEDNSCTVYDLKSRTVKAVYSQNETTWKVRWSHDEHLLFLMGKDQTYVFDHPDFNAAISIPKGRIGEVSVSPLSKPNYHVIVFNPGKGTPSFVRLYRYPNIDDAANALASRSVMKEDQVVFKWNSAGTHVLFLASQDMDEKSYYGSSQLFLMNTSSDSVIISLDAEGPIHAWEWNPKGDTFTVIYGFMPGKISTFSKKGDRVHVWQTQYRNGLMYNPFGNLLMLYGHGNIRGAFEVWDLTAMKKVTSQEAEYVTHFEWSPCGTVLLLATTSPRLKVGNKHKFVHYTGKTLSEQAYVGELFQITFRPAPPGRYTAPDPSKDLGTNYVPIEVKKATAYVPPSMRNRATLVGATPAEGATVHASAQALSNPYNHSQMPVFLPKQPVGMVGMEPAEAPKKAKKKKAKSSENPVTTNANVNGNSNGVKTSPVTGAEPKQSPPKQSPPKQSPEEGAPRPRTNTNEFRPRGNTNEMRPRTRTNEMRVNELWPRADTVSQAEMQKQDHHSQNPTRRPSTKSQSENTRPESKSATPGEVRKSQSSGKKTTPKKNEAREPSPDNVVSDDENAMLSTGDPERDKKIAKYNKKIAEINNLKKEQASGRELEKNQLDKIKRLDSIMKELEKLQLSALLKKK